MPATEASAAMARSTATNTKMLYRDPPTNVHRHGGTGHTFASPQGLTCTCPQLSWLRSEKCANARPSLGRPALSFSIPTTLTA
eukprot:1001955-Pyramimonas_sp.AAC.1